MPKDRKTSIFATAVAAGAMFLGLAGAAPAARADEPTITKLLADVVRVMAELKAPLELSDRELADLVAPAQELVDRRTNKSFVTQGGHPLPYYVLDPEPQPGCVPQEPARTVLFIGGFHPDEVSPLYTSFHALVELVENPSRRPANTRIIYVPLLNPDGLITLTDRVGTSTRRNLATVDLNRDFASKSPQTETLYIKTLIARFNPSHIIALHAPYGWLDYDGPAKTKGATREQKADVDKWLTDIQKAGRKRLPIEPDFGYYPGSLGNYGGAVLKKNVLTIEYPSKDGTKGAEAWSDYGDSVMQSLNPP